MSLVSIIIPVYNAEKYLEKCINSVINQTFHNLEIILVDDGSTDNSGIICDNYQKKDSRIKVIHQVNQGVSSSRNTGIENSTGEYLYFIDSDDWIENDTVEYLLSGIKNYSADISVCGSFIINDEETNSNKIISGTEIKILTKKEAIKSLIMDKDEPIKIENYVWDKMYKKSIFDGLLFPVGKIHEDAAITYKLIQKSNKIIVLTDPKYHHTTDNPNSLINQKNIFTNINHMIFTINCYEELKTTYPEYKNYQAKRIIKVFWFFIDDYLKVDKNTIETNKNTIDCVTNFVVNNYHSLLKESSSFVDKLIFRAIYNRKKMPSMAIIKIINIVRKCLNKLKK